MPIVYTDVNPTQKTQFEMAVRYNLMQPRKSGESIGTLREKRMHSVLKHYFSSDETCHEVRVSCGTGGQKSSKFVADVLAGNTIYEIQTGGFYPLRQKISYYLENTTYEIQVVHPLSYVKWTHWIDPLTGGISEKRRSPKKETVYDSLKEMYWLTPFLSNPRFSLCFMLLETEEFRIKDGWGKDHKKGGSRYEKIPIRFISQTLFQSIKDYANFLPDKGALPEVFTASQFGKATGLRGVPVYSALKLLCETGHVVQEGMQGRAMLFHLSNME